jgi:pimeloyl-ACP methyl ester carboxylesterase
MLGGSTNARFVIAFHLKVVFKDKAWTRSLIFPYTMDGQTGATGSEGRVMMERLDLAGISLDVEVLGSGKPMLYLHPEHYAHLQRPFMEKLAQHWKVYAPRHPGFDGRQPPSDFRRVDDLAYLYLNLLTRIDEGPVTVLGASFGGWVGMEMAVRDISLIGALGLIAPLGAKLGGRDDRGFADLSALSEDEASRCLFAEISLDFGTFTDDELTVVARDRQYLAYYAWKPYLHNPVLGRWLQRITVPTHLVWGGADDFAAPELGRQLFERIPQSQLDIIAGAGHYPQIECLEELMAIITVGPCAKVGG